MTNPRLTKEKIAELQRDQQKFLERTKLNMSTDIKNHTMEKHKKASSPDIKYDPCFCDKCGSIHPDFHLSESHNNIVVKIGIDDWFEQYDFILFMREIAQKTNIPEKRFWKHFRRVVLDVLEDQEKLM